MDELTKSIKETIATYSAGDGKKIDNRHHAVYTAKNQHGQKYSMMVPDPNFQRPPEAFAEKYGIMGVSEDYNLPQGLTDQDVHDYARVQFYLTHIDRQSEEDAIGRMDELWQGIKARNEAALGSVTVGEGTAANYYQALRGVAEGVTPADLQFRIDHANETSHPMRIASAEAEGYSQQLHDVLKHTHSKGLGWTPAPNTMRILHSAIQKTPKVETKPKTETKFSLDPNH